MSKAIYRSAGDIVDPVFFAVVPDSFMKRESWPARAERIALPTIEDRFVAERATLGPRDRWSF